MKAIAQSNQIIDRVIELYGDLIFDLCASVLWSPSNAQIAFRAVIRKIRASQPAQPFVEHERAWVLKITCEKLRTVAQRHGRRLSPSEQIMLDSTLDVPFRLKQFDSYFHRLPTDDQILLLLKDKYGLPYSEIASALKTPEDSLKLKRQQALKTLEEWLWDRV